MLERTLSAPLENIACSSISWEFVNIVRHAGLTSVVAGWKPRTDPDQSRSHPRSCSGLFMLPSHPRGAEAPDFHGVSARQVDAAPTSRAADPWSSCSPTVRAPPGSRRAVVTMRHAAPQHFGPRVVRAHIFARPAPEALTQRPARLPRSAPSPTPRRARCAGCGPSTSRASRGDPRSRPPAPAGSYLSGSP